MGALGAIYARTFKRSAGWSDIIQINETSWGGTEQLAVAMDGHGHAVAVWREMQEADGTDRFCANRFDAERGWSEAVPIDSMQGSGGPWGIKVKLDADGRATAIWGLDRGSGKTSLFANTLD